MKRRFKKKALIPIVAIILLIVLVVFSFKYIEYRNSNFYLLKQVGYTEEEISIIDQLEQEKIDYILQLEYDKNIVAFLKEKYFIFDNLSRYLAYQKEEPDTKFSKTVSLVNVKADYGFYDEGAVSKTKTDLDDPYLILVNKYNYLEKSFAPDDIVDISIRYAYGDNEIRKEVYEKFRSMSLAASEEDLKLIITSSYRDYDFQESLWDSYANQRGEEWADSVAARPGYSEHQTGLSLDIITDGEGGYMDTFDQTDEFKWLQKNAHKYGFILRYPEGKEDITGYSYESWHYRYVGVKTATEIHKLGITYDEYYAFYKNKIEG